jgi:hypothetical protein
VCPEGKTFDAERGVDLRNLLAQGIEIEQRAKSRAPARPVT